MRSGLLSELVTIGYEIFLEGENIKLRYLKQDIPPDAARPLIAELRTCKAEVVDMLKIPTSKSPANIMDGILRQTINDIDAGRVWQVTPEVRAIEDAIDQTYVEVLAGTKSIEDFEAIVVKWKNAETQGRRLN